MVITHKISIAELRRKYDVVIGWGTSRSEYIMKYNPCIYQMDYMVDINRKLEGQTICGMKISSVDILKNFLNKRLCIIVFPNIEEAVIQEASKYLENYDIVVSALVDNGGG